MADFFMLGVLKVPGSRPQSVWDGYGVELSEKFCEIARSRLHLSTVFNGTLLGANYPDEFFDYVLMWHVLERVKDPVNVVTEIARVLKPGGLLKIGVPNAKDLLYWIDRAIYKLKGETPAFHDSSEHICYFTPFTLRTLVEKAGLEVKEI